MQAFTCHFLSVTFWVFFLPPCPALIKDKWSGGNGQPVRPSCAVRWQKLINSTLLFCFSRVWALLRRGSWFYKIRSLEMRLYMTKSYMTVLPWGSVFFNGTVLFSPLLPSASLRCGADGYWLANRKLLLCGWRGRPSFCLQQERPDMCDAAGPRAVQP